MLSSADYQRLFEALPLCCVVLDQKLNVVTASLIYEEENKITVGQPLPGMKPDQKESLLKVINSATEDELSTPVLSEAGKVMFVIHQCKKPTARYEAELRDAREAAEAANNAKTSFLTNMSHEIRTPLAAIVGHSEFMLDGGQSKADLLNSIKAIHRNSQHLVNLVNEVLDLSKIEAGRLEVENLNFELREIIDYVEAVAKFKAREKAVSLKVEVDPEVPRNITTDPTRLRQILLNIVGNAVKFTEKGEVKIHINCSDNIDGSQTLQFKVCDTGIGVNKSQQGRLFKAFMQSDASYTRKFGGTGLGLVLSQKLARALGGDVTLIESEPGKGTVFLITIRLEKPTSQVQHLRGDAASRTNLILNAQNVSFKNLKILVVDDSFDNLEIIKMILKPTGARVTTAEDGEAGLQLALAGQFDVVLMDIQMPGLNGHQATEQLRKRGFRKPIIALTAHAMKEDRELAFKSGFDDHLTKPINRLALLQVIGHFTSHIGKAVGSREQQSQTGAQADSQTPAQFAQPVGTRT